jgi:protease II
VPYFLIAPADADRSRPQPTLLYGYGGFKIPVLTDYRPGWPCWLAAGGLLAIANLRGGESSVRPGRRPAGRLTNSTSSTTTPRSPSISNRPE